MWKKEERRKKKEDEKKEKMHGATRCCWESNSRSDLFKTVSKVNGKEKWEKKSLTRWRKGGSVKGANEKRDGNAHARDPLFTIIRQRRRGGGSEGFFIEDRWLWCIVIVVVIENDECNPGERRRGRRRRGRRKRQGGSREDRVVCVRKEDNSTKTCPSPIEATFPTRIPLFSSQNNRLAFACPLGDAKWRFKRRKKRKEKTRSIFGKDGERKREREKKRKKESTRRTSSDETAI